MLVCGNALAGRMNWVKKPPFFNPAYKALMVGEIELDFPPVSDQFSEPPNDVDALKFLPQLLRFFLQEEGNLLLVSSIQIDV